MRYEPTPGLMRALNRAAVWAKQLGECEVHAEHLFRGLVEDDETQPSVLLSQFGVVRESLASFLADPPLDQIVEGIPFAAGIRDILIHAQQLARSHSEEATVTSAQALLAALHADDGLRRHLESLGLDFAKLSETIDPPMPILPMPEPLNLFEPPEDIDAARVLDANANRCREALRVLEDYCRFILNDAFLSSQLKQLRHDLAGLMKDFPQRLLLASRDTLHDVGTTQSADGERDRSSATFVVQANAKRLQEALRTLEEFGKIFSPQLGEAFEKIRYQSYTLERALLLGGLAREQLANAQLYVLATEALCRASLLGTVAEAMAGGAQVIQLREKSRSDGDLLKVARAVRDMTRKAGVLFIVNDRPDIARLSEADGVHLGQDDMPLREARRIIGADALIGVSTHNIEQVRRAVLEGASYLGIGPTFPSQTKTFAEFPGLEFVEQALAETSLPAFALAGVNSETLPALTAIGCRRVAVGHAICAAEDPRRVAAQIRGALG
jgi:thiamine-phosphate pyrophosphorylase